LKKPLVDAMQGASFDIEGRFESAAYTGVREHFESIFNAAARRQRVFQQPASAQFGDTTTCFPERSRAAGQMPLIGLVRKTAVEEMVRAVAERWDGIDVLVNNAAGNFLAATEDLSPNGFDAIVRIVLHGSFHASLAAGRHMIERGGGGTILNILATYAWTGSAFVVPSAAAKAGVLAMTRSLAVEWAAYDIRVNAIAPGAFPTEGAWSRLFPAPELEEEALRRIPLGRFGRPEELADLAAFLVSDGAAFVNGECVTIDGGGWLASGGLFNGLARGDRARVKELMARLRGR
jgi:NAD(P)-dependent dehydrogenase (short-subunit alcohol dehydrogenase family)